MKALNKKQLSFSLRVYSYFLLFNSITFLAIFFFLDIQKLESAILSSGNHSLIDFISFFMLSGLLFFLSELIKDADFEPKRDYKYVYLFLGGHTGFLFILLIQKLIDKI